jgi:hypothetical protein
MASAFEKVVLEGQIELLLSHIESKWAETVHLPDQLSVKEHQIRGDFEIAERLLLDGDLHSGWFNAAKIRIPATPASAKLAGGEFWRRCGL